MIIAVAPKIDLEPIPVRRGLTAFQDILKGPEAASHVVKHAIQNHTDTIFVKRFAHFGKIAVGTKAAVDFSVIARIVAM